MIGKRDFTAVEWAFGFVVGEFDVIHKLWIFIGGSHSGDELPFDEMNF